jgi:HK97 family phage portal protein
VRSSNDAEWQSNSSESFQDWVENRLSVNDTASGEKVSSSIALKLSVVYSCINIISDTAAMIPFNRYACDDKGNKSISNSSPTDIMFRTHPNAFQTWFDFKKHLVKEALSEGNGYGLIVRNSIGQAIELQPLSSYEVNPYYVRDGFSHYLYYYVHGRQVAKEDIIHIRCLGSNGVIGLNPITIARESIGAGLSQQNLTNSMAKNGLNLQGVLETPGSLSTTAQTRLGNQMDNYRGSRNANKTLVLEEGLKYSRITVTPQDAQFLESRRYTNEEVARIYRVPLHKLQDLQRSTNNNIEHQSLEFYTDTMSPWFERIEQEFDMKLLYGADRFKMKHEFDVRKLLRTDTKTRSQYYRTLFNMGAITPNQIRQSEGDNSIDIPAMNKTYLQLAMSDIENLENNNGSQDENI